MTFDDWFYEKENYSLRCERFYDDLMSYSLDIVDSGYIQQWLQAAWKAGYEHRNIELADDGK